MSSNEKFVTGIFLVIQVLLFIIIMIAMGNLEIIREMLGLPSHEQSLVVFLGFWGICIGLVAIGSLSSFFSGKDYSIVIFVGLITLVIFVIFLLLLVFWLELAFFITFSIMILILLGMFWILGIDITSGGTSNGGSSDGHETSSGGSGSCQKTDTREAYYNGLKKGRRDNYKKRSTFSITLDEVMGVGNAGLSAYNKEERNAWEKGYQRGKWED